MKFLLVLLVVVVVIWLLSARGRERVPRDSRSDARRSGDKKPQAMAQCAHCGLHLPASDAIVDGSRVYCSEAHRRLGQGPAADR